MIFGPMMDAKLLLMYGLVFRKRFTFLLTLGLFMLIGLICLAFGANHNVTGSLSKYASSLILLEWGVIMLYFQPQWAGFGLSPIPISARYSGWSGRSLTLIAVIIAFTQETGCCGAGGTASTHDHDRDG